ncbi:hypothetical protein DAPPUDRAFT_306636 [Daphnia pulex]|uniref:Uncharacterized protein n=1 Tax=Daphnia pulex TaxID=6669 RepID=E9GXT9_DAPPU|nr:hypothetical protein DAPPUDRAFT_306636 [Daphnia pulex]|eukprot:EFX75759.1 hypothetical protein DAPPUDRAFT_306636 [Daphnia pulex]
MSFSLEFSCLLSTLIRGHQQDNEELVLSGLLREASEAAVCLTPIPKLFWFDC